MKYGAMKYGAMKYGAMKYGAMKYDVMKYGVMKYGVMKYGVMKYGAMKYGVMKCGTMKCGTGQARRSSRAQSRGRHRQTIPASALTCTPDYSLRARRREASVDTSDDPSTALGMTLRYVLAGLFRCERVRARRPSRIVMIPRLRSG